MKKITSLVLMTLVFSIALNCSASTNDNEWVDQGLSTYTKVANIRNHDYVLVQNTIRNSGGTAIVHAESCRCKKTKSDIEKEQGPRFFSKEMRVKKYNEQLGICPHCKGHFEFSEMEGDHIVPYSKGGKTEYSNLQMLCIQCNRKKGNRYSY